MIILGAMEDVYHGLATIAVCMTASRGTRWSQLKYFVAAKRSAHVLMRCGSLLKWVLANARPEHYQDKGLFDIEIANDTPKTVHKKKPASWDELPGRLKIRRVRGGWTSWSAL